MVSIIAVQQKSPIPFVIQPKKKDNDEKKTFYYQTFLIIVVNILLLLFIWQVINVSGYLSGIKIVKHNFEIIENGNVRFMQTIENDVWNNVVTYKINRNNESQWVIHDFKKELSIFRMRLQVNGGEQRTEDACYVTPMIKNDGLYFPSTPDVLAKQIDKFETKLSVGNKNVSATLFMVSEYEIIDREFFGNSVNQLCYGKRIFWIEPLCPIHIASITSNDGLKKNANQQLPEVDSLVCMECGCIKLSAPIVGGVSDIEIDVYGKPIIKCELAYTGHPVFVRNLAEPCDRPLRNCSKPL